MDDRREDPSREEERSRPRHQEPGDESAVRKAERRLARDYPMLAVKPSALGEDVKPARGVAWNAPGLPEPSELAPDHHRTCRAVHGQEVVLPDGVRILIRPLEPADRRELAAGFDELSPQSRYRRFLVPMPHLSERLTSYLVDVDHHDHEALIAEDAGSGQPLGVARYVRLQDDPQAAEIGVAVVDHVQNRGVGSALMHALVDRARREGIDRFTGLVLADNRPVLHLFRELGKPQIKPGGAGTVEVTVELPAEAGIGTTLRSWLRAAASERVEFRPPPPPGDGSAS